jgi:cob(I)alamin adenosyltransferase
MPKLTKIYTKTGDDGTTSLGTRKRVSKDSQRVKAYGDVDELNSMIGVAIASGLDSKLVDVLAVTQNELFVLGADLAFPQESNEDLNIPRIEERHVLRLEELIDELVEETGPLENFILPGGTLAASNLHAARAICRRAERTVVGLSREERISETSPRYLNRLSDALFVLARMENKLAGVDEPLWDPQI